MRGRECSPPDLQHLVRHHVAHEADHRVLRPILGVSPALELVLVQPLATSLVHALLDDSLDQALPEVKPAPTLPGQLHALRDRTAQAQTGKAGLRELEVGAAVLVHVHAEDETPLGQLAVPKVETVAADDTLLEEGVAQAELIQQLERPGPERARPPVDWRVGLILLVYSCKGCWSAELEAWVVRSREGQTDRRGGHCSPSLRVAARSAARPGRRQRQARRLW